ncbi:MAG TPA: hypothetical protein VNY51_10805 [Candidatus Dormibacteraeota bacterium]|nr:hypothetical protein [Candidatus Dormibacteraeota bacterium]
MISMLAVFASFTAWLFPSFGVLRKGFDNPSRLDLDTFTVLACWYLLIFVSFTAGEKVGGLLVLRRSAPTAPLLSLKSNVIYYGFTLLSATGIAATLIRVFQLLSLQQAIAAIALGQANELIEALYEHYSIGLVSLRYLVLYSASIALYRIIRSRSFTPLNIFNVLLLAISTLLSSRLIFIATLLTVVFLLSVDKRSIRISIPKLVTIATLLFLVLAVLNYSRNKGYYERNNLSFGLAGASEILAYLGSPFQVAIGTAQVTDHIIGGDPDSYRDYVDVEINLMTNSAFFHLHQQMGYFSWVYVALTCLFMGLLFEALCSLGETIFLLPCGAILYGSAELWRLYLFHQGTFIVWFVIGIGLPALLIGGQRLFAFVASAPVTTRSS